MSMVKIIVFLSIKYFADYFSKQNFYICSTRKEIIRQINTDIAFLLLNPNLNSGQIVDNNPVTTCISAHVKRGRDFDVRLLGVQTGGCTLESLPAFFLQNASAQGRSSLFDPKKAVTDRSPEPSSFLQVLTDSCQNTHIPFTYVTFPSFCP